MATALEQLEVVLAALPVAVFVCDGERVLVANSRAKSQFSLEIFAPSVPDTCPESLQPLRVAARAAIERGEPASIDLSMPSGDMPDTTATSWVAHIRPLQIGDSQGALIALLESVNESQLSAAERLSALSVIAASAAHELNNPLAYVLANLEHVLSKRLPAIDTWVRGQVNSGHAIGLISQMRDMLNMAYDGAHRLAIVARDLRSFSTADASKTQRSVSSWDVRNTVFAAIHMSAVNERVQVNCSLPDDLPAALGNNGEAAQALLHVLLAFSDRSLALEITGQSSARGVHVIVAAKGDQDSREPSADSLTHWRLAQTLLLRSGAEVRAESDRCELIFRTLDAQKKVQEPVGEASAAIKRVLIVDDEEGVARILETALRDRFEPTIASSGEEALRLIVEDSFDAIVCDVNLSDMNGVELFQKIARIRPEQLPHLIFITGGVIDDSILTFIERAQVPCLEKPFRISEVIRAVQSRL